MQVDPQIRIRALVCIDSLNNLSQVLYNLDWRHIRHIGNDCRRKSGSSAPDIHHLKGTRLARIRQVPNWASPAVYRRTHGRDNHRETRIDQAQHRPRG